MDKIKIWFIIIDGKKEGPYSRENLKRHIRLTPDTLAWREGLTQWLPIRQIPELKIIFEDESAQGTDEKDENGNQRVVSKPEENTLAIRYEPPSYYFWMLMGVLIILYTLYQWFSTRP